MPYKVMLIYFSIDFLSIAILKAFCCRLHSYTLHKLTYLKYKFCIRLGITYADYLKIVKFTLFILNQNN